MNAKEFRQWLIDHRACKGGIEYVDSLANGLPEYVWEHCDRGDYLLWWHEKAGTPAENLAPVAYRAATRATGYAADALDSVGIPHSLHGLEITDAQSAGAAARLAEHAAGEAGEAREARDAARQAVWAARAAGDNWVATWAATGAASRAAWDAAWAARAPEADGDAARGAELKQSADDCRELLEMPGQTMKHPSKR